MSTRIQTVTDASFDADITQSTGVVLVDFWAPWCGPCKAMAPLLDELAGDYEGLVRIAKVNADDHTESAEKLGVRGLPTLIFFKHGQEVERVVGTIGKSRLASLFDKHLEAGA